MKHINIDLANAQHAAFNNLTQFCVGTGRMDLALQAEYLNELDAVQAECGFKHIRGHGLFSERMGIWQQVKGTDGLMHERLNFTYLDRVMDAYLQRGLEPFIELGFMPAELASDTDTVFWWKGNITPPADPAKWAQLVRGTLRHLLERYGDRAVTWPVEVWNEPNLSNFWKDHDKQAYFELYRVTSKAVKEADSRFRVGGPAICGGDGSLEWVRDFLAFCRDEKLPLDFVTRHAYMGQASHRVGHYMYHSMCSVDEAMVPLTDTREIIDSFPEYRGMDMHVTEFNTSYNSRCPIHDTNLNAAIIAHWLSKLGDVAASYSYWTFGDVFEEEGVPAAPFHGGFGLMAGSCISKPTLWSFAFYRRLTGKPVYRDGHCVITKSENGDVTAVLWNDTKDSVCVNIAPCIDCEATCLKSEVSPSCSDPLRCWHDMGEPDSLTRAQTAFLRDAGRPLNTSARLAAGEAVSVTLEPSAVVYIEIKASEVAPDYGYDYGWYTK